MASIGGGARKKEQTPRRSSSRGRTVDYKKMHEGSYGEAFKSESELGEHLTETIPPGASLGSAVLPEVEVTLDDYGAAFSQLIEQFSFIKFLVYSLVYYSFYGMSFLFIIIFFFYYNYYYY